MKKYFLLFLSLFFTHQLGFAQNEMVNHWETVVYPDDVWKYSTGYSLPDGWNSIDFDDSRWLSGKGGFGYNDNDDNTVLPSDEFVVTMRKEFEISDISKILQIELSADYDDGFIAYLNGNVVAQGGIMFFEGHPLDSFWNWGDQEAYLYRGCSPESYFIPKSFLKNGKNTLVIHVRNNWDDDMSSNFYLSVGIKDASQTYRTPPSWFREKNEFDSNLPLVFIDTYGRPVPDEPKMTANMGIIDNGPGKLNKTSDNFNSYNGLIGIELRGQFSLLFPKKSFGIELRDKSGHSIDSSLMGMPADNDWVLYSAYIDKSLLRNYLIFNLANSMGYYAPRMKFCELFLNGEYNGVYLLMEKIKRGKNRVAISELKTTDNSGDDLTGGYIFKIDKDKGVPRWESSFDGLGSINSKIKYSYEYPKYEVITSAQKNYIMNFVNRFETTMNSEFFGDPYKGYRQFIDEESFVDNVIMNEFTKNVDGYRISSFFYKDRDSIDGKLHAGPIWDYDLSFGSAEHLDSYKTDGWFYTNITPMDPYDIPFWWSKLMTDSKFRFRIENKWNMIRKTTFSDQNIIKLIDSTTTSIKDARLRNFKKWPVFGRWKYPFPHDRIGMDYDGEITFLKEWIAQRSKWLDTNIPYVADVEGSQIHVFPVPAHGYVFIVSDKLKTLGTSIELINTIGQTVIKFKSSKNGLLNEWISLKGLPAGLFFARISSKNGQFVKRVLIK
jgi:hypothetical protein